jgi:aminoglycoside/choline kinase family phosphotransferase
MVAGMGTLPRTVEDVDARFLTVALADRHPGTRVDGCEIADLRQGSASSLGLDVHYEANPHRLPTSLFLKADFTEHGFTSQEAFASEVTYYLRVADTLAPAVNQPRAYFAATDEAGQSIVILEDVCLRGVEFGDCERPLNVDTVADGVRQLASMQGKYWNGNGFDDPRAVHDVSSVSSLMMFLVQQAHFDDYMARERASFVPAMLRDRTRMEAALGAMFDSDRWLTKSFVHGDAHLGNTFREPNGRLGFCDFQASGLGPYIWDVTYFITGALDPNDRSDNERDLLGEYLDGLRGAGVAAPPSLDETFLAHRRHMMHGYLNVLTPVEMQPDRFAIQMGSRFVAALTDLDTLGCLI